MEKISTLKVSRDEFLLLFDAMNFHNDFTHGDLHKKNWKVEKWKKRLSNYIL